MTMYITGVCAIIMLSAVACAVLYLYVLGTYGLFVFFRKKKADYRTDKRFIVLIPAHNEELLIAEVIKSIRANDYSPENYEIIIIADNCTDSTADIARELNVAVWERTENELRGKGYALGWAIDKIKLDSADIITVIDADNAVEPDFFKTVAGIIGRGIEVVQTFSGYHEVDKSPYAYLQYLSNLVENHLFYYPRSLWGLHNNLKGSGMAFRAGIFNEVPWLSHSITEDYDYSIDLLKNQKEIVYTPLTKVYEKPSRAFKQAFGQRVRGSSGVIQIIKRYFFKLLFTGLRRRDFVLCEYALSLLIASRPSLIYICVLAIVVGLFGHYPALTTLWGVAAIALLVIYLFLGALLHPQKGPIVKAVLLSPVFGVWLFVIQLLSACGFRKNQWVRTERVVDDKD